MVHGHPHVAGGQGSMRHRSIAQPLVPWSTRQLVSFLSIPLYANSYIEFTLILSI